VNTILNLKINLINLNIVTRVSLKMFLTEKEKEREKKDGKRDENLHF